MNPEGVPQDAVPGDDQPAWPRAPRAVLPVSARRQFLAAAAAAGGFAPYVFTSHQARAASKNDRPRLAAIGLGGQGVGIATGAMAHADLVACCDVDRRRAEKFAGGAGRRLGKSVAVYTDFRRLLDRPDVDVVTIATPDHWHAAIAIRALRTGRDVYCEKPLALTIAEGQHVRQAVHDTGRVFQAGTQQRSMPLFLKALALARSGRIGRLRRATCLIGGAPRGGPFPEAPPPDGLDWDFWLGQAPQVPYVRERCHYTFRWWQEYSGGKMSDWGAHHVDIAQWALGHEHTGPVAVSGRGEFPTGRNCYNTAVAFHVDLTFADGAEICIRHAPLRGPWFEPAPLPSTATCPDPQQSLDNGIWLDGERGTIFVNRKKLAGRAVDELTPADDAWLDAAVGRLYQGRPVINHMADFFQCVADRGRPISDVDTTHRTISSCHLANIALRLGRRLAWDPAAENFAGDAEANAMLSRLQRPGYTLQEMTR